MQHVNNNITLTFSLSEGFLCYCTFETKDIPKQVQFSYIPEKKVWQTWDFSKAKKLEKYADIKTKKFLSFFNDNLWQNITKIRRALHYIRVKCDYAHSKDDEGFNQANRKLGWELDSKHHWSQKDLVQAAYLVYFHRRQCYLILKN